MSGDFEIIRDIYLEAAEGIYRDFCNLEFGADTEGGIYMEEVWRDPYAEEFCRHLLSLSREYRLAFWDPYIFARVNAST